MPPAIASLTTRLFDATSVGRGRAARIGLLVLLHLAALAILLATESTPVSRGAFLLTWGLLNFGLLVLLRRPAVAAALSLAFLVVADPAVAVQARRAADDGQLRRPDDDRRRHVRVPDERSSRSSAPRSAIAVALALIALALIWYFDPLRVRRRHALAGAVACLGGLVALSLAVPNDPWDEFYAENYVSKFARSGVTAIGDLITRGVLESDATASERLAAAPPTRPARCTSRRTSSWCSTSSSFDVARDPGREGAGRLRRAFPLDRRQAARADGRRAPAARAGTPSTMCSPASRRAPTAASRISSRASRRAGSSAACRTRCGAAATRPSRSIRCTARS